jgi:hypothetical protein
VRRRIARALCHACICNRMVISTPKAFSMRSPISGESAAFAVHEVGQARSAHLENFRRLTQVQLEFGENLVSVNSPGCGGVMPIFLGLVLISGNPPG